MRIDEFAGVVLYTMDLIGIFAFALSGAFLAVRKDFDIFGTIILAEAAGLGGGLFRDLVLDVRPVAFSDPGYHLMPVLAALAVFFSARIHRHDRLAELFDLCDVAALGLFSVTGTIKALNHDFHICAAIPLGMAGAVGGGVLSCVLAIEVPNLFRWSRDLYILPALTGASAVVTLHALDVLNAFTAVAAALFAIALRFVSLRYGWHTPRAYVWRNPFSGMRQQPLPDEHHRGAVSLSGPWPITEPGPHGLTAVYDPSAARPHGSPDAVTAQAHGLPDAEAAARHVPSQGSRDTAATARPRYVPRHGSPDTVVAAAPPAPGPHETVRDMAVPGAEPASPWYGPTSWFDPHRPGPG